MLNVQDVPTELEELYALERHGAEADALKRKCSELTKVVIRAGFELVMEREQRYTTSLYYCYQSFAKYYPQKASLMEHALRLYLNPSSTLNDLTQLAHNLCDWLVRESDVTLKST